MLAAGNRRARAPARGRDGRDGGRERVRIPRNAHRLAERDELEARLALEGLREQLRVELAGLGAIAVRHLVPPAGCAARGERSMSHRRERRRRASTGRRPRACGARGRRWPRPPKRGGRPRRRPSRRRRAGSRACAAGSTTSVPVNPFAADEYAEVRTRLDGLEGQRIGSPGGDRPHPRPDPRAGHARSASSSGGPSPRSSEPSTRASSSCSAAASRSSR